MSKTKNGHISFIVFWTVVSGHGDESFILVMVTNSFIYSHYLGHGDELAKRKGEFVSEVARFKTMRSCLHERGFYNVAIFAVLRD